MIESKGEYHIPVMLDACLDYLIEDRGGVYVDATFGGGGHSRPILNRLDAKGFLIAFDHDKEALNNVIDDDRFELIWSNYKYISNFLEYLGKVEIDGVLADLGVSSHQLDVGSRGFSFRFEGPLDMRMNDSVSVTAKDILNAYSAEQLQRIFSAYGEVRNAKTLAKVIVENRSRNKVDSSAAFVEMLDRVSIGDKNRYKAQVFQALRIEVNDELSALRTFLESAIRSLKLNGRMVVMSYHSLEDKIVKEVVRVFQELSRDSEIDWKIKWINKKPIMASVEECRINPRARSAKLRVLEKTK